MGGNKNHALAMKAYLGLGSNIGDSRANISATIEKLKKFGTVERVSSFFKTEPVGFAGQPWFLNCALVLETGLSPEALLVQVKQIEKELGRTPAALNGPRAIDIDILLYGDVVLETDLLTIPHSRMHERRFVLAPLSEIAPDVMHSVLKKTIAKLLMELHDTHRCERLLH